MKITTAGNTTDEWAPPETPKALYDDVVADLNRLNGYMKPVVDTDAIASALLGFDGTITSIKGSHQDYFFIIYTSDWRKFKECAELAYAIFKLMPAKSCVRFYSGMHDSMMHMESAVTFTKNRPSGVVAEIRDWHTSHRIDQLDTAIRYHDTPLEELESEKKALEKEQKARPVFHPNGSLLMKQESLRPDQAESSR